MVEAPNAAPTPKPSRPVRNPPPRGPERNAGGAEPAADDRTAPTGPSSVERVPTVCRWRCPVCGATRDSILTGGRTEAHVLNDLRSHLRAAGDAHGSPGALPPGLDPDALGRYVGRGRAAHTDTHGDE